jgi:conjugal transfer mating pair stabilization protein TraN
MNVVAFIGLMYTIYNLTKLLINLLTQCDENEQDMGIKLAQKQCFAVGDKYCGKKALGVCYLRRQDWCCYSSMLSRIIADQGSKQIGKDMASCPGFTIEEFGRLDFDRLDLSEWLATMYEADILSTSGYDIERMTGTGRMHGNLNCDDIDDPECEDKVRKNANVRALEQFGGNASDTANELKETFDPEQIDCSVYPRPLICEMQGG